MRVSKFVASAEVPDLQRSRNVALSIQTVNVIHQLVALLLLTAASPVLLLIGLGLWLSDGSPILFAQYRVGEGGRLFRCLKFRTMRLDAAQLLEQLLKTDPAARAEWELDQKLRNDPRITTIGRFLRKTSLDELPQLFNVLQGEMRLVGPRPITPTELKRYDSARWYYVSVRPGITGLWQVSGRNNTTYEERVALDRHYVRNASLTNDLKILIRTARVVVSGHGAR